VRSERLFLDRNAREEKKFSRRKKNYTHRKKTTLWQRVSPLHVHALNADARPQHDNAKRVTGIAPRNASAVIWKRYGTEVRKFAVF
jgi:hypothetical protein